MTLIAYKDWSPTQFDTRGLNAGRFDIGEWLVAPCILTRDSKCLERANWDALLQELARVDPETEDFQTHSFGHWACGWFEIVLVRPDTEAAKTAQEIADALEDYPIVSDSLWSQYETEAVGEYWNQCDMTERMQACVEAGVSFLAARHDAIPEAVETMWRESGDF